MQKSEQINELAAALAKAQGQIANAVKDSANPYFDSTYADLASVWDAVREPLSSNGLAVVQAPSVESTRVTVSTVLIHSSGQWIQSDVSLQAKDAGPQSVGSAITYGRRYGLSAIAGVAPEDDDAEAAAGRPKDKKPEPADKRAKGKPDSKPREQAAEPLPGCITEDQQKSIFALMHTHSKSKDQVRAILSGFGFAKSSDITTEKYDEVCAAIAAPKQ